MRAPTTPAITTGTTIAPNSLGSRPVRAQRDSATLVATSTPIASIKPYACNGSGPMFTMPCFGLGMNATVTAQCYEVQVEDGGLPMQWP